VCATRPRREPVGGDAYVPRRILSARSIE
jgi:hypothetical protein